MLKEFGKIIQKVDILQVLEARIFLEDHIIEILKCNYICGVIAICLKI